VRRSFVRNNCQPRLPNSGLALKYKPGMAIAHSSLCPVLMDLGKPKGAEAEFREGLRLDPQLEPALVGLGVLRTNQGDDQQAEKILRQAIERDPKDEKARLNLGLVLAKQQKFGEGEAQVRQAKFFFACVEVNRLPVLL